HYLPAYFFATIPLLFSALILSAVFFLIKNFKSIRINLFIILCLLMAVGAIIMQNITNTPIYNGWRHYYFIFVPLVFVMTYALACFLKLLPKPATIILSLCFSLIALQMIIIHPYQYLYFNPAFISNPLSRSDHVTGNFERDYWGVGGRAALTWILNHDTSAHITVMTNTKGTYLAPLLMPAPERERLNVIYLTDEPVASSASYIVYNYTNDLNNAWLKDGWHPIWSQTMLDSYNIWSIHAREK
ncbi:hypothetical protein FWH30_03000, partial [Microgenomates group bacterium]|nr:hypothetical protein [Microgenomates group bacterium]